MKTICKLSILILAVAFTACRNEMDNLNNPDKETIELNEIVIADGVIQSPQWLVHAYDSITRLRKLTPAGRPHDYPVYSVKYGDQEYILIVDWFNSNVYNGHFYYTLSGEQVDKNSDLFDYFLFNDPDESNLIYFPGITQTSVTTKAFISTADVYTPNGSLVPNAYISTEELTQQNIAYYASLALTYPQVTILAPATTTYNCHAYAWHMTEGGSPVWINGNPVYTYTGDGSYIPSSVAPTKVAYLNDDHSAITTSVQDIFIAKWGSWPLVRHHKNYSPYNTSNLSYLKLNDMPPVFISRDYHDYSGSSTIYAYGGYAGITLSAFSTVGTPTSYVWSANFYGDCDRWYLWPSNSRADVSVYLGPVNSGGTVRIECELYNGSTLLGVATYYLSVYPQ